MGSDKLDSEMAMENRIVAVILFLILCSAGSSKVVYFNDEHVFRSNLSPYRVELFERRFNRSTDDTIWNGGSEVRPSLVVTSLAIWYNDKKIVVPRSAFADLSMVNEVMLKNNKKGFTVSIIGGDAGDSYTCAIQLRKDMVVRRIVRDNEFPDSFYEETSYVSKPIKE